MNTAESNKIALRIGVIVLTLAALFGMSTQAQAAPQTVTAGADAGVTIVPLADLVAQPVTVHTVNGATELSASVAGPDDVTIQASYTFNRANTERIYTAARAGGAAALGALCVAIAPGWLKVIGCPVFVAVVLSWVPEHPPNGKCLQVYTKWTRPFIGVRYVNC